MPKICQILLQMSNSNRYVRKFPLHSFDIKGWLLSDLEKPTVTCRVRLRHRHCRQMPTIVGKCLLPRSMTFKGLMIDGCKVFLDLKVLMLLAMVRRWQFFA